MASSTRKRTYEETLEAPTIVPLREDKHLEGEDEDSTELKLAMLSSLHPDLPQDVIFEALVTADGSVDAASALLAPAPHTAREVKQEEKSPSPTKRPVSARYQSSIATFAGASAFLKSPTKTVTKKGRTLHLYTPESIAAHTPCTLVPNFLDPDLANDLLRELLEESNHFGRDTFKLFDAVVTSPHSSAFYVDPAACANSEYERPSTEKVLGRKENRDVQPLTSLKPSPHESSIPKPNDPLNQEFFYNGSALPNIRLSTPLLSSVSTLVQDKVNAEIAAYIRDHCPNGEKLKYQSPHPWRPNTAFVNCYDGGKESVGFHADQLTYLGPRAIIGSVSLGVEREFRVRRIVPKPQLSVSESADAANTDKDKEQGSGAVESGDRAREADRKARDAHADTQGQIAIHLPHNSLLVMHAAMQEEWKHAIQPAATISPHPVAGNKRINVTYRHYRDSFHPRYIPKCRCGVQCVLRCSMKSGKGNRGRYMWMCHTGYSESGGNGCGFFEWGRFDEDGEPPWAKGFKGVA